MNRKRKREIIEQTEEGKKLKEVIFTRGKAQIFADPTYDTPFKMLFGTSSNKHLTVDLINSLFDLKGANCVQDIEFLSQELNPSHPSDKKSTLDVRCKTDQGYDIVIEMQRQYKPYFICRMQYYMARLISEQGSLIKAENLHKMMTKTYMLVISKENLYKAHELPSKDTQDTDGNTIYPMVEGFNGIEMPQNLTSYKTYETERVKNVIEAKIKDGLELSSQEQWLDFFNKCAIIEDIPKYANKTIQEAYEKMKKENWNTEEKRVEYYMEMFDEACEEWHEQQIAKQAETTGEEKGIAKGIAKGIDIGKVEAKLEMLVGSIQKHIPHETLTIIFSPTFNDQQISIAEKYISEHQDASSQLLMEEISKLLGESAQTHTAEG